MVKGRLVKLQLWDTAGQDAVETTGCGQRFGERPNTWDFGMVFVGG